MNVLYSFLTSPGGGGGPCPPGDGETERAAGLVIRSSAWGRRRMVYVREFFVFHCYMNYILAVYCTRPTVTEVQDQFLHLIK